jgi:hypothetical protein
MDMWVVHIIPIGSIVDKSTSSSANILLLAGKRTHHGRECSASENMNTMRKYGGAVGRGRIINGINHRVHLSEDSADAYDASQTARTTLLLLSASTGN